MTFAYATVIQRMSSHSIHGDILVLYSIRKWSMAMASPLHEGANVGVFAGMTANDTSSFSLLSRGVYASNGSAISAAVGRVSFVFGLQGPCAAYDTACSSALVALHAAVRNLQHNDCDAALVAAVAVMLTSRNSIACATAGMTSPTGRCHTFDEAADGYARAEGCGALRHRHAENLNRNIYIIIHILMQSFPLLIMCTAVHYCVLVYM